MAKWDFSVSNQKAFDAKAQELRDKLKKTDLELNAMVLAHESYTNKAVYWKNTATLAGRAYTIRGQLAALYEQFPDFWDPLRKARPTESAFDRAKAAGDTKEAGRIAKEELFGTPEQTNPYAPMKPSTEELLSQLAELDGEIAKRKGQQPAPSLSNTQSWTPPKNKAPEQFIFLLVDECEHSGDLLPVIKWAEKLGRVTWTTASVPGETERGAIELGTQKSLEEIAAAIRASEFYGLVVATKRMPAGRI